MIDDTSVGTTTGEAFEKLLEANPSKKDVDKRVAPSLVGEIMFLPVHPMSSYRTTSSTSGFTGSTSSPTGPTTGLQDVRVALPLFPPRARWNHPQQQQQP
jgi:hypothetical protein